VAQNPRYTWGVIYPPPNCNVRFKKCHCNTRVNNSTLAIRQRSAYHAKYLRICWTYLDLLYRFCRRILGNDYPNIYLVFTQGTLPWQPLNLRDVRRLREEQPLLVALSFKNGLADRKPAFKRLNGNNWATLYKFGKHPFNNLGVYAVQTHNFCHNSATVWRGPSFVTLAFWNGLEECNFYFRGVIGYHFCTSCRNLVRFSSVTTEFSLWKRQLFPGPILTYFTILVDDLMGMIIPIFVWWSPKGHCYGNRLNLEDGCRHCQERTLLLALAFENGLAEWAIRWALPHISIFYWYTLKQLISQSTIFTKFSGLVDVMGELD